MSEISITVKELKRLNDWIGSMPKEPHKLRIEQTANTAVGCVLNAYTDNGDGSGEWKQLTVYSEW